MDILLLWMFTLLALRVSADTLSFDRFFCHAPCETTGMSIPVRHIMDHGSLIAAYGSDQTVNKVGNTGFTCNTVFYANISLAPTIADGDLLFCQLKTCVVGYDVYCYSGNLTYTTVYGTLDGYAAGTPIVHDVPITQSTSTFNVPDFVALQPVPTDSRRRDGGPDPSCIIPFIIAQSSGVMIKFDIAGEITATDLIESNLHIDIRKGHYHTNLAVVSPTVVVGLPLREAAISGPITFILYQGNILCETYHVQWIGRSACYIPDCILCAPAFEAFDCLPATDKTLLIVGCVLIGLLALIAFPAVLALIVGILILLYKAIKFVVCIIIDGVKKIWSFQEKAKTKRDILKARREEDKRALLAESGKASKKPTQGLAWYKKVPLLFAMGTSVGASSPYSGLCTTGLTVPSEFTNCIDDGTFVNCTLGFDLTVEVPFPGATACLDFYVDEEPIMTIDLDYAFFYVQAVTTNLYYTTTHSPSFTFEKKCHGSNCNPSKCSDFDLSPDPTLYGVLDDIFVGPTEQGCSQEKKCGGTTKNSCVYWAWGVVPDPDEIVQVASIDGFSKFASIGVRVTPAGVPETDFFSTLTTSLRNIGDSTYNMSARLVGTYDSSEPAIASSNKLVYPIDNNDFGWITLAADYTRPKVGDIGDIQSKALSGLTDEPFNFYMADDLCQVTTVSNGASSTCISSSLAAISPFDSLPKTIHGNLWVLEDGVLYSQLLEAPPAVIHLRSTTNFKITRTSTLVCPEITFVGGGGCYSCSANGYITFRGKSTCTTGFCAASSDQEHITLFGSNIILSTTSQDFNVTLISSKSSNIGTMTFTASGGEVEVDYDVTLINVQAIPDTGMTNDTIKKGGKANNRHRKNTSVTGATQFFTESIPHFLYNGLTAVGHWFEILISYIIGVIVLVVIVWACIKIFTSGKWTSSVKSSLSKVKQT